MVRVVAVVIILIMMMSVYAIAAAIKVNGGEKNDTWVGFICTQFLNDLS